jgi:hypothetical protein
MQWCGPSSLGPAKRVRKRDRIDQLVGECKYFPASCGQYKNERENSRNVALKEREQRLTQRGSGGRMVC